MQQAVCTLFLLGAAFAARLDNNYLPPTGAAGAGGSNGAIAAPFGSGGGGRGAGGPSGQAPSGGGGSGFPADVSGGRGFGGASPGGGAAAGGGAPAPSGGVVPIITQTFEPNMGDGTYSFSFEAGNGIKAEEKGRLKELPDGAGTVVEGSFSYPGPDGKLISITYTADENGFVPQGDHLPTPPPIPEEIRKALEQNGAGDGAGGVGSGGGGGGGGGSGGVTGYPQSSGGRGQGGAGPGVPAGGGGDGRGGSSGYSYPQPGK